MVISNLEQMTWSQPGNVGNTGGWSAKPHGTFLMTPAKPCVFSAAGAITTPYDNGYWLTDLTAQLDGALPKYFEYRLSFMFPTAADMAACQAIEFELQDNPGSRLYNMAWSAFGGLWHYFDYNSEVWVETKIPAVFAVGEWVDVKATFLRGGDATLTHLTLSVDGTEYMVAVTQEGTAQAGTSYLHAAFQLDSDATDIPYVVQVRGMSVRAV